ncbi:MAG: HD domain-containing protein [Pseudomonadota bacterium]
MRRAGRGRGRSAGRDCGALLHDLGHLLDKHAELGRRQPIDRQHEEIGAGWVARWFQPAVAEIVRLHVPAKRWLCGTDAGYFDTLSPGLGALARPAGRSVHPRRSRRVRPPARRRRRDRGAALGRPRQDPRPGHAAARAFHPGLARLPAVAPHIARLARRSSWLRSCKARRAPPRSNRSTDGPRSRAATRSARASSSRISARPGAS